MLPKLLLYLTLSKLLFDSDISDGYYIYCTKKSLIITQTGHFQREQQINDLILKRHPLRLVSPRLHSDAVTPFEIKKAC